MVDRRHSGFTTKKLQYVVDCYCINQDCICFRIVLYRTGVVKLREKVFDQVIINCNSCFCKLYKNNNYPVYLNYMCLLATQNMVVHGIKSC